MSKPAHQLLLKWNHVFTSTNGTGIQDRPPLSDYVYFTDRALEDTDYYVSSYMCPVCEAEETEDGVPALPLLYKLKPQRTEIYLAEDDDFVIYNLFTCPSCNRFFVSILEENGKVIKVGDMPLTLRDFAYATDCFYQEDYQTIIKQSLGLTQDPEEHRVVIENYPTYTEDIMNEEATLAYELDDQAKERILTVANESALSFVEQSKGFPVVFISQDDVDHIYCCKDKLQAFVNIDNVYGTGVVQYLSDMANTDPSKVKIPFLRNKIYNAAWGNSQTEEFQKPSYTAHQILKHNPGAIFKEIDDWFKLLKTIPEVEIGIKVNDEWYWFDDIEDERLYQVLNDIDWTSLFEGEYRFIEALRKLEYGIKGVDDVNQALQDYYEKLRLAFCSSKSN